MLLQENVHSGHCSALECTNRQGPVTRRCLTFVTRVITVIVTHHVAIATCVLFEIFYARGDLVSCTPSVLSYYACSSVSQKTQGRIVNCNLEGPREREAHHIFSSKCFFEIERESDR